MNTANHATSTSSSESCNTMSGGGQGGARGRDVTRESWWEEVGYLVDAFEAELHATGAGEDGATAAH